MSTGARQPALPNSSRHDLISLRSAPVTLLSASVCPQQADVPISPNQDMLAERQKRADQHIRLIGGHGV